MGSFPRYRQRMSVLPRTRYLVELDDGRRLIVAARSEAVAALKARQARPEAQSINVISRWPTYGSRPTLLRTARGSRWPDGGIRIFPAPSPQRDG
jgi:hypothetical protein